MAYQLFTLPKQVPLSSGAIVPGARLRLYLTGTTTPAVGYSDSALTTPITQPIEADAAGVLPVVYLDPDVVYKATVSTSADALLYTVDPINETLLSQAIIGEYLYPRTTAEIAAGVTPTDYSYPPGDVRRYGAVGDDSTNCTTAIQAAIDQNSEGGSPVFVPEGTFQSNQLSLASNVTIYGLGYWSCIKARASANNYIIATTNGAVYIDDVWIFNIRVDGNKANNTSGGGIYCSGRRNFICNNYIHDTNDGAILFGPANSGVSNVPDCGHTVIAGNIAKNAGDSNTWGAIGITHGRHIVISNNTVDSDDGGGTYGIDVEPNSGNMCSDIVISNNTIRKGRLFIDGQPMGGSNVIQRVVISGNNIDADGSYRPSDGSNMACIWLRQCKDVSVTGNTCFGDDTSTFSGIHCDEGAITTTWNVENLLIANNIIRANYSGARPGRISQCRNVTLIGNQWECSSSSNCLEFPATERVRGSSNTIRNAGAGTAVNIGSTAIDVQFDESNNFLGTVTVNATSAGTGSEVRRLYKGSATYDPPNLADGAGATTTVTVTGAALGDFVDGVSFSLDLQGITVTAWVSSANTVSVRFQNETGGAIDLASGTLSARVRKVA